MDLANLHELINHYFNEEELKTLCFSLSPPIDYESLEALGKAGKARELVAFCNRHERIDELNNKCKELRPRTDWLEYARNQYYDNNHFIDQEAMPRSSVHSSSNQKLKVFLCHSSSDKDVVRGLYHNLVSDGFEPWLDEEDLLPGQNWRLEISRAVRTSDIVLVCLSRQSVTKRGYVQKEIRIALDIADEQPEGTIFLVPIRLEDCIPPDRLSHLQRVDVFQERGYEQLLKSLNESAKLLGITVQRPPIALGLATVKDLPLSKIQKIVSLPTTITVKKGYPHFYLALRNLSNTQITNIKVHLEFERPSQDSLYFPVLKVSEFSEKKPGFIPENNFEFVFKGISDWQIYPKDTEVFGFHFTTVVVKQTEPQEIRYAPDPSNCYLTCTVWLEGSEKPIKENLKVIIEK